MKTKISLFLALHLIMSCTVTKRVHMSGYSVQWKHKYEQNANQQISLNIVNNLEQAESDKRETVQETYFEDNSIEITEPLEPRAQNKIEASEIKKNKLKRSIVNKSRIKLLAKTAIQVAKNDLKIGKLAKKQVERQKDKNLSAKEIEPLTYASSVLLRINLWLALLALFCILISIFFSPFSVVLAIPVVISLFFWPILSLLAFILAITGRTRIKKEGEKYHENSTHLNKVAIAKSIIWLFLSSILPIIILLILLSQWQF